MPNKPAKPETMMAKAQRRAKRLPDSSILEWTMGCLGGMMRYAEMYQQTRDTAALAEFSMSLGVLQVMVDELITREEARHEEDTRN
jgi:hypothetical protein